MENFNNITDATQEAKKQFCEAKKIVFAYSGDYETYQSRRGYEELIRAKAPHADIVLFDYDKDTSRINSKVDAVVVAGHGRVIPTNAMRRVFNKCEADEIPVVFRCYHTLFPHECLKWVKARSANFQLGVFELMEVSKTDLIESGGSVLLPGMTA